MRTGGKPGKVHVGRAELEERRWNRLREGKANGKGDVKKKKKDKASSAKWRGGGLRTVEG